MANHAKVCTGKTLDPKEVDEIVQKINKEKLKGLFTLTYTDSDSPNAWGKHSWFLQYKDEDYIGMNFWLSDEESYGEEKDGEFIEYDEPKILSTQSCIEFRHGHSFRFMWWVEGIFRENLGKYYNAKMWDDGIGECEPANPERYESFKSYLTFNESIGNEKVTKTKLRLWKKFDFGMQKKGIPKELIDGLDLDFKI